MPIQSSCPACQEQYRLPEEQIGKRVRCRACGDTFLVRADEEVPVLEELTEEELRRTKRKPAREVETLDESDAIEERPSRRSRAETPPPPSRRRRDDDEDEDDRPSRRSRDDDREEEEPKKSNKGLFVILGVLGAVLFLCIGGTTLGGYLMTRTAANQMNAGLDKMAAEMDKDRDKFGQPGGPFKDKDKLPDIEIDLQKDKIKINLPPVVVPPKEPEITTLDQAIEALRSAEKPRQRRALAFLQRTRVEAVRRDEVARLLNPIIISKEPDNPRFDALLLLKTWATRDNFDELALIVGNSDIGENAAAEHAMEGLATIGDEASIEALVKQLDNFFRVQKAGKALERIGSKAEKHVVKHLHDPKGHIRTEANRLLKAYRTKDEVLVGQVIVDLDSANNDTRNAALDTVMAMKPPNRDTQESVSKLLENFLSEDGFGVRDKALRALRQWATKDNFPKLVELAKKDKNKIGEVARIFERFPEDDQLIPFWCDLFLGFPAHRSIALRSLKLHPEKAEPVLLDRRLIVRKLDAETRRATYELLSEIGTKASLAELKAVSGLEGQKGGSKENVKVAQSAIQAIQEREKSKGKDK